MTNIKAPALNPIPQGWQCPICKVVYSPDTTRCFNLHSDAKLKPSVELKIVNKSKIRKKI